MPIQALKIAFTGKVVMTGLDFRIYKLKIIAPIADDDIALDKDILGIS